MHKRAARRPPFAAFASELDALLFTPKAGAPNTSSPTTFTLSDLGGRARSSIRQRR